MFLGRFRAPPGGFVTRHLPGPAGLRPPPLSIPATGQAREPFGAPSLTPCLAPASSGWPGWRRCPIERKRTDHEQAERPLCSPLAQRRHGRPKPGLELARAGRGHGPDALRRRQDGPQLLSRRLQVCPQHAGEHRHNRARLGRAQRGRDGSIRARGARESPAWPASRLLRWPARREPPADGDSEANHPPTAGTPPADSSTVLFQVPGNPSGPSRPSGVNGESGEIGEPQGRPEWLACGRCDHTRRELRSGLCEQCTGEVGLLWRDE